MTNYLSTLCDDPITEKTGGYNSLRGVELPRNMEENGVFGLLVLDVAWSW